MSDSSLSKFRAHAAGLLHGERVRLRPLAEADLPTLATWWNDPEWMVLQQDRILPRAPEAAYDMFRRWSANDSESGVGYCVVNEKDELIGHIALWGLRLPVRIATFAIIIGPEYVGQGYGTDAVRVALRIAFEELGANKVELQAYAFNERALRAYTNAGFVEEGRRRAAVYHHSAYADEILMGILRTEYHELGRHDRPQNG
jgi:RimJ/RimL family protein N-acetyltransferase